MINTAQDLMNTEAIDVGGVEKEIWRSRRRLVKVVITKITTMTKRITMVKEINHGGN